MGILYSERNPYNLMYKHLDDDKFIARGFGETNRPH